MRKAISTMATWIFLLYTTISIILCVTYFKTPQSIIFPMIFGLTTFIMILFQIIVDFKITTLSDKLSFINKKDAPDSSEKITSKETKEFRLFVWLLIFIILIPFVNYLLLVPVFSFLILKFEARQKMLSVIVSTLIIGLSLYFLFYKFMSIRMGLFP